MSAIVSLDSKQFCQTPSSSIAAVFDLLFVLSCCFEQEQDHLGFPVPFQLAVRSLLLCHHRLAQHSYMLAAALLSAGSTRTRYVVVSLQPGTAAAARQLLQ